ncbi:MAG: hypothetical protein E6J15_12785 [Chloroflexi bacterium]|nr:MAG: hypothetical protein E6J15_12785 [Chloroflexota bacterium]
MSRENRLDLAIGAALAGIVVAIGAVLGAWTGYPKGVDAANHLTRLKFVADWFPHHNWLYAWAAGMPTFDNYPGLAYVGALPLVTALGPETTLKLLALLAMVAFTLGLFGHLRLRGIDRPVAVIATLMALTSMSVWQFITADGVYARVIAMGFGALAWWAHAAALRNRSGRAYALTAVLLALTVAAHPVTGAFAAGYVALVQLAAQSWRGLRPLAVVAFVSMCLAAQPLTSPLTIGIGGRILGVDRPELSITLPIMIVHPWFLGFAALTVPALTVFVAFLSGRRRAAIAGAVALLIVLGYIFAPNFGIPTRYYYINGIDPNTVPYFLAIVGGIVFAYLAPPLAGRGRAFVIFAGIVVLANAVVSVPAILQSPYVADTTRPEFPDTVARRTLVVDGNDLAHRILPLTASEAVWFNYIYLKPQLRDYYTFGLLNPDWLFWVFDSIYHPPLNGARIAAIFDWYAPSDYDRVARLLFDEGASPRTRVPLWWSGRLADLPVELADRAASVVLVGDRLGDAAEAQRVIETVTGHGATILWDIADRGDATLPAPWPVSQLSRAVFDRWDVIDRQSRISAADFSPASFEGGPWGAAVPIAAQPGAIVHLSLGTRPLIVSAQHATGSLVVVGGNLLYHAQSKANAAERRYLLSFITPSAQSAEREPAWRFVHPERREIETDGSPVLLKESLYPKWHAHFVSPSGSDRPLRIFYAGPGLMLVLPSGPGTVVFDYESTLPIGWAAWVVTLLGVAFAFTLAWRKEVFVVVPRLRDPTEEDDE